MAYTAGIAQPGVAFAGIGSKINSNVADLQQAVDYEKLRQFQAALAAQQQMPQGYDAQGIALGPSQPGGRAPITPPTGYQQYVSNAGLNYALNKLIKPPTAAGQLPQGYDAEGNAFAGMGGGGGSSDLLGTLGHGNVGKYAALLKTV